MVVKIQKRHEKAVVPVYGTDGSAGMDLTAVEIGIEHSKDGVPTIVYSTGLSIEIPEGYVGLIFPRSSISKMSLVQTNCVGVIDSDYRGIVTVKYKVNTNTTPVIYTEGEKFAQLIIMPYPKIEFEVSEELTETERGEGGYGSTDTKQPENNESTEIGETSAE